MTPVPHDPAHIRRSARRLAAALALAALAAAAPATAAVSTTKASSERAPAGQTTAGMTTDPDDTLGRLDLARVEHRATSIDRRHVIVSYRARTFDAFTTARLDPDSRNLVLELNRDSVRGSERNVRISSIEGRLVAEVISNATREVIATVQATRPNDYTVQITGPRRLLGARSYFWTSNYHAARSPSCGRGDGFPIVCQDSVPQHGWARMDRPGWPG